MYQLRIRSIMKTEEQIRLKLEEYEKKINDNQNKTKGNEDSTEFIAGSLFIMIYLERVRILKWVLDIAQEDEKASDLLGSNDI